MVMLCVASKQTVCVCVLPEQEDVEWHSDRVSLSADPNGL